MIDHQEVCCGCDRCLGDSRQAAIDKIARDIFLPSGLAQVDAAIAGGWQSAAYTQAKAIGTAVDQYVVTYGLATDRDPLDEEREELANDRAHRQTLAWKHGVDEHGQPLPKAWDPASILDLEDPWAP